MGAGDEDLMMPQVYWLIILLAIGEKCSAGIENGGRTLCIDILATGSSSGQNHQNTCACKVGNALNYAHLTCKMSSMSM